MNDKVLDAIAGLVAIALVGVFVAVLSIGTSRQDVACWLGDHWGPLHMNASVILLDGEVVVRRLRYGMPAGIDARYDKSTLCMAFLSGLRS